MLPLSRSTLFPYTTLFRSAIVQTYFQGLRTCKGRLSHQEIHAFGLLNAALSARAKTLDNVASFRTSEIGRAHVELQSHSDLVCRLLLEKKKKHIILLHHVQ